MSTRIMSGNLTAMISDDLHQFLIAPEICRNSPNFNQENFILDYLSVDWKNS